jgi:YidC/Oxa1 family membrane protein insertase
MKLIFTILFAFLMSLSASAEKFGVNEIPQIEYSTYTDLDIPDDPIDPVFNELSAPQVVDDNPYGIFWIVVKPVEFILETIDSWINNLGITLILFAILIKIIFYDLSLKSYIAKEKIKLHAKKLITIKEKYKEDPQKLKENTLALYSETKTNPGHVLASILAQIPIFIIVMVVIRNLVTTTNPTFIHIDKLSIPDPLYILPIILGLIMIYEQWHNVDAFSPAVKKAFLIFPIFFMYIFTYFSAGILLYIITIVGFGVLQEAHFRKTVKIINHEKN